MIGVIGDRAGFHETGGIRTLAKLLVHRLENGGMAYRVFTARECSIKDCTSIVILGCSSPWAYTLVLLTRIRRQRLPIHWIPCYHPAHSVSHKNKARIARWTLRGLQKIGVNMYALTNDEYETLECGRCALLSLPFDCEKSCIPPPRMDAESVSERPYSLVYLGRPVTQKGWPQFLELVTKIGLDCLALVPFNPRGILPDNLKVIIGCDDMRVSSYLKQCRMLILPSDYESFGFAQAEALLSGCCVPVLGEWPLWVGDAELDWRGLSDKQVTLRVATLLSNPSRVASAWIRQYHFWMQRPERLAPSMPLPLLHEKRQ
jgi:glycosyltransferase involved in cell wall biosynthesis